MILSSVITQKSEFWIHGHLRHQKHPVKSSLSSEERWWTPSQGFNMVASFININLKLCILPFITQIIPFLSLKRQNVSAMSICNCSVTLLSHVNYRVLCLSVCDVSRLHRSVGHLCELATATPLRKTHCYQHHMKGKNVWHLKNTVTLRPQKLMMHQKNYKDITYQYVFKVDLQIYKCRVHARDADLTTTLRKKTKTNWKLNVTLVTCWKLFHSQVEFY